MRTRSHDSLPRHSRGVQDLVEEIDAYLAQQLARTAPTPTSTGQRRNSCGTMFVDWDGHGQPVISYRRRDPSRVESPPLIVADSNLHVRHMRPSSRRSGGIYVEGCDPATGFEYDYDGTVMHVHRDASRPSSQFSEYYAVDANEYKPQRPLRVVDKELPPLPHGRKKRDKVCGFIQKVMKKLDGLGLMKQFKEEKKMAVGRGRGREMPRVRQSWLCQGYVT